MEQSINSLSVQRPSIDFARLDIPVSLDDLQSEVARLPQAAWVDHVNRDDYNGVWDVLTLRCQKAHLDAHPILQGFAIEAGDDWAYTPLMDSCPAIGEFLGRLECPLKGVRLMRLKAGAEIKPHRDRGLSIEYGEARLHLPVQVTDDVLFTCNNQPISMRAGELWYFDADREHSVCNRGRADRINIVIDCIANDWLRGRIFEYTGR